MTMSIDLKSLVAIIKTFLSEKIQNAYSSYTYELSEWLEQQTDIEHKLKMQLEEKLLKNIDEFEFFVDVIDLKSTANKDDIEEEIKSLLDILYEFGSYELQPALIHKINKFHSLIDKKIINIGRSDQLLFIFYCLNIFNTEKALGKIFHLKNSSTVSFFETNRLSKIYTEFLQAVMSLNDLKRLNKNRAKKNFIENFSRELALVFKQKTLNSIDLAQLFYDLVTIDLSKLNAEETKFEYKTVLNQKEKEDFYIIDADKESVIKEDFMLVVCQQSKIKTEEWRAIFKDIFKKLLDEEVKEKIYSKLHKSEHFALESYLKITKGIKLLESTIENYKSDDARVIRQNY